MILHRDSGLAGSTSQHHGHQPGFWGYCMWCGAASCEFDKKPCTVRTAVFPTHCVHDYDPQNWLCKKCGASIVWQQVTAPNPYSSINTDPEPPQKEWTAQEIERGKTVFKAIKRGYDL